MFFGNERGHIGKGTLMIQCQHVLFHSTIKKLEVMKQKYHVETNVKVTEGNSTERSWVHGHGVIKMKMFIVLAHEYAH